MAKMWAGVTDGNTAQLADDFNSSIRFDSRMYRQDITGSMAHAAMLGAKGIIEQSEAETLIDGLQSILDDLVSGALAFDMTCEDIHMFVEQVLTERLGDVGKKLHTARSRNDQVALDLRLYLAEEIDQITGYIRELLVAVTDKAEQYKATIMPGYTHLQRAQPITWSPSDGLRDDAHPGFGSSGGLQKAHAGIPHRLLCSGRHHLRHRPPL